MNQSNLKFRDIDAYHACQPIGIQHLLEQLRQSIRKAAPDAAETISYGMPAFREKKMLVYYAVHKNHIGFYPTSAPILHFKKQLEAYHTSTGTIQFPFHEPLPLLLIEKIVQFRVHHLAKEALCK